MDAAELVGERNLWGAVVNRAILDALWPNPCATGSGTVSHQEQRAARSWIGSRGFREACQLAGFEPDFVRDRLLPLLDDPEAALAFSERLNSGEAERRRSQGRRLNRGPKIPKGGRCAVPGCGAALYPENHTGVCRHHNHAAGYCLCTRCGS